MLYTVTFILEMKKLKLQEVKHLFFILIFFKIFIGIYIVDLQYCVSFYCIYSMVNQLYIHPLFFLLLLFSHRSLYRVLSKVPCAIQ